MAQALKDCSFKPDLTKKLMSSKSPKRQPSPIDVKHSSRRDKSPLEIEFEKNKEHCTFKPDLQKKLVKKNKKATHKPKNMPLKPSLPAKGIPMKEIEDLPTPFVRAVETSPDKEEESEITISPNHQMTRKI